MLTKETKLFWYRAIAADGRERDIVEAIALDAEIDAEFSSILLSELAYFGGGSWLLELLNKGAALDGLDREGKTALGNCILGASDRHRTLRLFCALLKAGANPNQPAAQGFTPLQLSIERDKPEYTVVLLLYGADISQKAHVLGSPEDSVATAKRCHQDWASRLLERWRNGNDALVESDFR